MIVVTGANGFIGANLVCGLNRRNGKGVVGVDRYPSIRNRNGSVDVPHSTRYPEAASAFYLDLDHLANWLTSDGSAVDALVHLGACSDTTETDRDFIMSNNFDYTRGLWRWCTEHQKPFIYASSAATYGDGSRGYDDQIDPSCFGPMNLYGQSKHRFDLWALRQTEAPPRWAGVKYFNVYGPRESHKRRMASMAHHWFNQVRQTGEARLFESHRPGTAHGEQNRDFVYVGDAVDATLHLLNTPVSAARPNGLYNVGTGQARTFVDLARAVFAALGREPKLVFIPMPDDLRNQYQYFTQAKVTKLRRAGFTRPFLSIDQGVCRFVEHCLAKEEVAP